MGGSFFVFYDVLPGTRIGFGPITSRSAQRPQQDGVWSLCEALWTSRGHGPHGLRSRNQLSRNQLQGYKNTLINHINNIEIKKLTDSKKLTKIKRENLDIYIKNNSKWSIGTASIKEIEKYNILKASLLAMRRAIKKLKKK